MFMYLLSFNSLFPGSKTQLNGGIPGTPVSDLCAVCAAWGSLCADNYIVKEKANSSNVPEAWTAPLVTGVRLPFRAALFAHFATLSINFTLRRPGHGFLAEARRHHRACVGLWMGAVGSTFA